MDDRTDHFQFPVQMTGHVASTILKNMAHGRVAALFNSSFYLESESGFVCIGNENLGPGPLNIVTMAPAGTNWPASGLRLNEQVSISPNTLHVGRRFSFLMTMASTWSPEPIPGWDIHDLERGIRIFREVAAHHVGPEGLGSFLISGFQPAPEHSVCATAAKAIAELQRWLIDAVRNRDKQCVPDLGVVQPMLGLGPGLTPSGDDFIGGVMIALHALGETRICRQLWEPVRPGAENASNPISCAHLKAASHGEGSETIHCAMSAVLKGYPLEIQNCLSGIEHIGHTSGWDIMAGAIIAFESRLEASTTPAGP